MALIPSWRWLRPLLGLVCLLAPLGCDDEDEQGIVLPPVEIRRTFPVDQADLRPLSPLDLAVTLTRGTGPGDIQMGLYPEPPSVGAITRSNSGRNWAWLDASFSESDSCYFWLIDGFRLGYFTNLVNGDRVFVRKPELVRIRSSAEREFIVGFAGRITSLNPNVLATGAVVFALPLDSGFNPLEPGTFDATKAVGLAVASRGDDFVDLPAFYTARFLPMGTGFQVVAIKDTNEDTHYSPIDDWWGVHEVDGEPATVFAHADTKDKGSLFNESVNIFLQAPAPLPELPEE